MIHQTNRLRLRSVEVNDLKTITAIYRATQTKAAQSVDTTVISEDFGIPVCVVEVDKNIAGYLSLHTTGTAQPSVNTLAHLCDAYTRNGMEETVKQMIEAETIPHTDAAAICRAYGFENVSELRASTQKLVRWLNDCAQ